MQIQNHKEEVPFEHYAEKFRALDPQEASRRTGAAFDPERGTFSVALLGVEYHIAWPEYAISADEPSAMALKSLPCQTFLLRFLRPASAYFWEMLRAFSDGVSTRCT